MEAFQRTQLVEEDGKVTVVDLPVKRGQMIQVIVLAHDESVGHRRKSIVEILKMDAIGMWADRDDIGDSVEFARALREAAQARDWTSDDSAGH